MIIIIIMIIRIVIMAIIKKRTITSELQRYTHADTASCAGIRSLSGSDLGVAVDVGDFPPLISKGQLPFLCPSIIHPSVSGSERGGKGPVKDILCLFGPLPTTTKVGDPHTHNSHNIYHNSTHTLTHTHTFPPRLLLIFFFSNNKLPYSTIHKHQLTPRPWNFYNCYSSSNISTPHSSYIIVGASFSLSSSNEKKEERKGERLN
ncbi:hypothetical protein HOY82DRAFT_261302 [Tuber indicum]|nr:hypothetical protein HOY82DRAFT_261302 [Tuber indicum]